MGGVQCHGEEKAGAREIVGDGKLADKARQKERDSEGTGSGVSRAQARSGQNEGTECGVKPGEGSETDETWMREPNLHKQRA